MLYQNDFYSTYPRYHQEDHMPHKKLVHTLHECAASCFHTLSTVLKEANVNRRQKQIQMLHDCARVCESQAAFTVMNSPIAKQHAQMCAMVCENCAMECDKFNDQRSQECADMCRNCAMECREYAGSY